jgi:hypothetical protein
MHDALLCLREVSSPADRPSDRVLKFMVSGPRVSCESHSLLCRSFFHLTVILSCDNHSLLQQSYSPVPIIFPFVCHSLLLKSFCTVPVMLFCNSHSIQCHLFSLVTVSLSCAISRSCGCGVVSLTLRFKLPASDTDERSVTEGRFPENFHGGPPFGGWRGG